MSDGPAQRCICDLRRGCCDGSCTRLGWDAVPYVVCLDLRGRCCVVVGAGRVGLSKARGLLDCGAVVTVVSPAAVDEIEALARAGLVEWLPRPYRSGDAQGAFLVIAATDDVALNVGVVEDAAKCGSLVNAVNVPALSSFVVPAVVNAGPAAIAITTSGSSPALARRMKRELTERYG